MKRSPLQRKTPLCSRDTKPKERKSTGKTKGKTRTQRVVRGRSGGDCEVRSPWCLGKATNLSHRNHEGQGGKWEPVNILDSCGWGNTTGCHGYIHQHPEEARDNGWTVSAFGADPAKVDVLMWHEGRQDRFLLLNEEPFIALAPWPEGDPRHPDDIEVPAEESEIGGAA